MITLLDMNLEQAPTEKRRSLDSVAHLIEDISQVLHEVSVREEMQRSKDFEDETDVYHKEKNLQEKMGASPNAAKARAPEKMRETAALIDAGKIVEN
eukprot:s986_g3.t1